MDGWLRTDSECWLDPQDPMRWDLIKWGKGWRGPGRHTHTHTHRQTQTQTQTHCIQFDSNTPHNRHTHKHSHTHTRYKEWAARIYWDWLPQFRYEYCTAVSYRRYLLSISIVLWYVYGTVLAQDIMLCFFRIVMRSGCNNMLFEREEYFSKEKNTFLLADCSLPFKSRLLIIGIENCCDELLPGWWSQMTRVLRQLLLYKPKTC